MSVRLPFLTTYDPPGTSEGTLDPLGLYQIAEQLAIQLVPAVRERMQRIRFLTAMAVGSLVTEGVDGDPALPDASPYLVWEWLFVEAMIRSRREETSDWGVPGTLVTKRAVDQHGYLDARSYLKTPRIFGFHGVYKRLAIHLGFVDVHLGVGPNTEQLVDAWARGLGLGGLEGAKPLISRWSTAVRRSLSERPPRTKPNWDSESWSELAEAFAPTNAKAKERRCIRDRLLASEERRLGALPHLWHLQAEQADDLREERLHDRLEEIEPEFGALLEAIRTYEAFARSAQDAFDVLRAEAARPDAQGFCVTDIGKDEAFGKSVHGLHNRFEAAHKALFDASLSGMSLHSLFDDRFSAFAEPLDSAGYAQLLCSHHAAVQRGKSADGKRPWFDRLGDDRIYVRHAYRIKRPEIQSGRYLHDYRGWPIRRFHDDLS